MKRVSDACAVRYTSRPVRVLLSTRALEHRRRWLRRDLIIHVANTPLTITFGVALSQQDAEIALFKQLFP